jgi:hypothetical protein
MILGLESAMVASVNLLFIDNDIDADGFAPKVFHVYVVQTLYTAGANHPK